MRLEVEEPGAEVEGLRVAGPAVSGLADEALKRPEKSIRKKLEDKGKDNFQLLYCRNALEIPIYTHLFRKRKTCK